jgi:predicted N-acetyltransferase YhbS
MQVERLDEMRITSKDEAQIGALLDAAFNTEFGGRSYYQQRHHVRLIVRNADVIVGHMAISLRAIRMGDALVQVAGLAEVATDPDRRGQGIASTLMKAAIAEAQASPAAFFVLFGDQPLYAASGFVTKTNLLRYSSFLGVQSGEVIDAAKDGLMVMSLRDELWDDTAVIDLVGHAF